MTRDIQKTWRQSSAEVAKRIGKMGADIVTSPPVLWGAGVVVWNLQVAGPEATITNAIILAATIVSRGYESWTGKEKGVPYYVRAGSCIVTLSSIIHHGTHGASAYSVNDTWNFCRHVVLPAASSFFAGLAYLTKGLQDSRGPPKKIVAEPMFHAGISEITATASIVGITPILAINAAGLVRSMQSDAESEPRTWRQFRFKHGTSARFYMVGYVAGCIVSAIAKTNLAARVEYSVAQLLWAAGFALWDRKENREFVPDFKRLKEKEPAQTPTP